MGSSDYQQYVVQNGDTLWGIVARHYNLQKPADIQKTVAGVLRANGLPDSVLIKPKESIWLACDQDVYEWITKSDPANMVFNPVFHRMTWAGQPEQNKWTRAVPEQTPENS
ncbi:MAG: LysM domain-containing protein [Deltaproteobacteria bacterium]|nr:LysM domain-containing protein [Deltaproteobacteria bacterium]